MTATGLCRNVCSTFAAHRARAEWGIRIHGVRINRTTTRGSVGLSRWARLAWLWPREGQHRGGGCSPSVKRRLDPPGGHKDENARAALWHLESGELAWATEDTENDALRQRRFEAARVEVPATHLADEDSDNPLGEARGQLRINLRVLLPRVAHEDETPLRKEPQPGFGSHRA